ncbi:MAG: T9SS type A sorting domain-containing protein [bacterium]|nr:T9SS type A sorting domain-containing protein [bacterium]
MRRDINSKILISIFLTIAVPRLSVADNNGGESLLRDNLESSISNGIDLHNRTNNTRVGYGSDYTQDVPAVIRTYPDDDERNIVRNSNVYIYFSEEMDESTLTEDNITLRHGNTTISWLGEYIDESDEHRFTIDPASYFPGSTEIRLTITADVLADDGTPLDTDSNGLPGGSDHISEFDTSTSTDSLAPSISDIIVTPNPYGSAHQITITALASDSGDPGHSIIIECKSYIGDDVENGIAFPVKPYDGSFDEEAENISITIPVSGLPEGDEFDVKITAEDSAGKKSQPVIVTLYKGSAVFLDEDKVFAFPNPCYDDKTRFYFYVTEPSNIVVEIYDLKGRLVGELSGNSDGYDLDSFLEWNASGVAPGVYIFSLSANAASSSVTCNVRKRFALLR